jgi:hypothetical protein
MAKEMAFVDRMWHRSMVDLLVIDLELTLRDIDKQSDRHVDEIYWRTIHDD